MRVSVEKLNVGALLVVLVRCKLNRLRFPLTHIPAGYLVRVSQSTQRDKVLVITAESQILNLLFVISYSIKHVLSFEVPDDESRWLVVGKFFATSDEVAAFTAGDGTDLSLVPLQVSILLLSYAFNHK